MRFCTRSFVAAAVLAGTGVLLLSGPALAQQPCFKSECEPTTTTTSTTTTSTTTSTTTTPTTTSTTTPGGTTTTPTTPGDVGPTTTPTTGGGGPNGRPVIVPTTTATTAPEDRTPDRPRAPTGGLPVTGGDILTLSLIGFVATAFGAGILRRR